MSVRGRGRWFVVRRAVRRVRMEAVASVALVVVAAAPALLLVGWVVGDRWGLRSASPLVLVGTAVILVAGAVAVLARRWVTPVSEASVAAAAERRRGLPDGSLRGVMELGAGLPSGVSGALFRRTEREMEARLEGASPSELAGELGARVRGRGMALLAMAGLLAVMASAAGFAAPERARAGWTPLLHPVAHLRGPVLPALTVRPGDGEVGRGEMVNVEVLAPLRDHVIVEWRVAGGLRQSSRVPVWEGRAAAEIGPVDAAMEYQVRSPDGAASARFTVHPVDPLMLAGIGLDVDYPEHTGRAAERFDGELPSLVVPVGTMIRLRARATRPLETASLLRLDGAERAAATQGATLALDWDVGGSDAGHWELRLRDAAGVTRAAATLALQVTVDAPPRVRILAPGRDTVLAATRRQPLVVEAADDYGLAAATLVAERVGARGDRGAPVRVPLPLEAGVDRALIHAVLDVSEKPLVPGDAVEYYVEVRDNSPGGQTGRSAGYLLRVPGRSELREQARAEARELTRQTERSVERARDLDRATRELSRRTAAQRGSGQGSAGAERSLGTRPMDFQQASEARALTAGHEEALSELEALRHRADRLQTAIERAGLRDAELERRLQELQDLYARLDRKEIRERIEAVREAADALDGNALTAELEQLMISREEMQQRLEESLALLEQAVLDQEMKALAREAEEIAAHQEALATAMREDLRDHDEDIGDAYAGPDTVEPGAVAVEPGAVAAAGQDGAAPTEGQDGAPASDGGGGEAGGGETGERRAAEQEELAGRTQRLNDLLGALQKQLMSKGDTESASQAGEAQEQGQSAQESMEAAAEQARQGLGEGAADSAEQAAGALASAARSLDEARGRMGEAGREQAQEAVRRAAQEALRLAEREEALRRQMAESGQGGGAANGSDSGEGLRQLQSEQMALRQGLEQLGRNLSEATRQSGALDPEVSRALARAMIDLEQTASGLQAGRPLPVGAAERSVQSLNRLAMALLENEVQSRRPTGTMTDQALRRLAELAAEQSALNAQVAAFAPLDVNAAPVTDRLEQLAEHQRGIARRVGELSGMLGGREDVLGQLDQLSKEAAGIAHALAGARTEADVRARQERLFHRLLDAGRTLEREEYSDERVGERAERQGAAELEALDPALLEAVLRYPSPDAAQLRAVPAAYRRLILEYFDRLNNGSPPGAAPAAGGER
jgi:hypothetical protein